MGRPVPLRPHLLPNLTLIFVNKSAVLAGGDSAVACYAAISYLTCVVLLLIQGVTDGSQPLLSLTHGRGDERGVLILRGMTLAGALLTAGVCAGVLLLLRGGAAALFGASPEVTAQAALALPVFLPGLLCAALSRTATSYCYATQRDRLACLLIYGEPAALLALLLLLPRALGLTGVWAAVPLSPAVHRPGRGRPPLPHPRGAASLTGKPAGADIIRPKPSPLWGEGAPVRTLGRMRGSRMPVQPPLSVGRDDSARRP